MVPVHWRTPVGARCAHIGAQQNESVLADDLAVLDHTLLRSLVRHGACQLLGGGGLRGRKAKKKPLPTRHPSVLTTNDPCTAAGVPRLLAPPQPRGENLICLISNAHGRRAVAWQLRSRNRSLCAAADMPNLITKCQSDCFFRTRTGCPAPLRSARCLGAFELFGARAGSWPLP